jgi:HK97 family phage portal protein
MKIFGRELTLGRFESPEETAQKAAAFESALLRIVASQSGYWGNQYGGPGPWVTPESCMQSPTVQAIVTAISRRISVSPVGVYRRVNVQVDTDDESLPSEPRIRKVLLPNHPVAQLLAYPNDWQSCVNYWTDAASRIVRYGNFFAYKSRGATGPIRALIPVPVPTVTMEQDLTTWAVTYRINGLPTPAAKVHHARGPARNGFHGDSPVADVNRTIALEIAAEQFGQTFFSNGALPLMVFQFMAGSSGFKTDEERKQFIDDFQRALSGPNRHRALLLPKMIEAKEPVTIDNDKSQFLETRKYQRTVIAGAFNVPPHLVGDLERATFNNVEQQSADFTINVVLPWVQAFQSAMERDLLTTDDINGGVIIRFDLDSVQLADFKSRQEGLKIQREAGVICPNDWRERENQNPIPEEDGGEDYIRPLNFVVAGSEQDANLGKPGANQQPGDQPPANQPAADSPPKRGTHDDAFKQLVSVLSDRYGELCELVGKVAKIQSLPPNIIINIPEQPAPVVYNAPADVQVNVAPTPVEMHVEMPKQRAPDVHVHVPPATATETVPVRDQHTGKVVSLVNRPLKSEQG